MDNGREGREGRGGRGGRRRRRGDMELLGLPNFSSRGKKKSYSLETPPFPKKPRPYFQPHPKEEKSLFRQLINKLVLKK